MTPIADMVEKMLADHAEPGVIVLAIRAVETVALRERDASRSVTIPIRTKAAERAARYRQKIKRDKANAEANDAAHADSQMPHVERDASRSDRDDAPTLLPSLSLNLEGSIEEGSKSSSKKARSENARARGTRMQLGAVLSDEDRAAAIELGAAPAAIPDMWSEFVDYWTGIPGQRGTKLGDRGWSGTWRNRVRAIVTKGNGNANGHHRNGTAQAPRSGATGQDAILAGMGRLADRIRARGDAERREREASDDGGAAAGNDARLI